MVVSEVEWVTDPEWWSANRAERAIMGAYELVAFDIPPLNGQLGTIGWELFGGPKFANLVSTGDAVTFEEAQAAAEAAWRRLKPTEGS